MSTASAPAATSFAAPAASLVKRYTPPKPAPLPEDYEAFYGQLTPAEKELDALAKEWLGSSYEIQWTHMYLKWSKGRAQARAQAQEAKEEKKE
jgi:hypothetical protein